MNADEDLAVLRNRLFDVLDFYDLWRSISVIDGGLHAGAGLLLFVFCSRDSCIT